MRAAELSERETLDLIRLLPPDFIQARRMVEYLSHYPHSATGYVAQHCAIGNLSDVAHKLNPFIYKAGYLVGCERPARPFLNKFGEASNQFKWSVYQLPDAANDSEY